MGILMNRITLAIALFKEITYPSFFVHLGKPPMLLILIHYWTNKHHFIMEGLMDTRKLSLTIKLLLMKYRV